MDKKTQETAPEPETADPAVETAVPAATDVKPGDGSSSSWGEIKQSDNESFYDRVRWVAIKSIPTFMLKFFTGPYIAGSHYTDALTTAKRLYDERGIHSTIDVLGEDVTRPEETKHALQEYLQVIDNVGKSDNIYFSIKLSALGQGLDDRLCDENVEQILEHAARYDLFVRFDMEDHTTIDATLSTYKKFIGNYPNIGVVLQSMLFRTPEDYDAIAHLRPNVRGVIGIYREPAEVAYTDKPTMKEKLLDLFEKMWTNGSYVCIATHDRRVIRRALEIAQRMGKTTNDYEVQMLLGVPLNRFQDELVAQGIKVRLYVPYGEQWAAYCRRRLYGNPNIAALAMRNMVRVGQ